MEDAAPVPPQYAVSPVSGGSDFRRAALGPTGYKMCRKRKMEEYQEQVVMAIYIFLKSARPPCMGRPG